MLNRAQLVLIDPAVAFSHLDVEGIASNIQAAFNVPHNGFLTVNRRAAFVGQLCVESSHFGRLNENLNYSTAGLWANFHTHFNDMAECATYAHDAERIANRVYANRMGNGDEASGDGWKYRGRGLIQLTGKANYEAFSQNTLPEFVSTAKGAVDSAVWFYTIKHNLNPFADTGDITSITKIINGGTNGLGDRIKFYNKGLTVLQAT